MTRMIDTDTFESTGTGSQSPDERFATLAHDLRTPLGSVKLWGELLRSGKIAATDVPGAIDAILAAAAELEQLIEQLLGSSDYGRAGAEVGGNTEPSAAQEPSSPNRPPLESLQGVTVLIAEDDLDTRVAMQLTLAQVGACVLAAESADAALSLAQAVDQPEARVVLVSDLRMPRMSGFELVAELGARRRRLEKPLMPACAVSAHLRLSQQQALDAGFDMFLAKPFTPQHLISAVADLSQVERDGADTAERPRPGAA
jgi:CheY-like chemotaxis protein